ncbi:hypothetical protein [Fulvivirga sediminis]|uniref:Uncharacterized protein n=1 Tax=Fulvivirga sediminis TaxID=2803949 RepID=A0A937F8W9_9BACT|nr:hypothetical protein [Fulvivirga sediminis]MBL3658637.1 hypothetical protein [Fulvivirga sediminis]
MGDWRTLHLFDSNRYKEEVVPAIKDIRNYLSNFLTESRLKWLNGFGSDKDEIIHQTIQFISELNLDLSIHPKLKEIQKQKLNEPYKDYIKRSTSGLDDFRKSKLNAIEFFEFLLSETIFSTVSNFNPYFVLGKRIFESCIETKKNTIAEELTNKIVSHEIGSILDLVDGGIINWLDSNEVKMLHLDLDNIMSSDNESEGYVYEFKIFIKWAYENNLGLISLRNPSETYLSQLQKVERDKFVFDKSNNFKSIIINKSVHNG